MWLKKALILLLIKRNKTNMKTQNIRLHMDVKLAHSADRRGIIRCQLGAVNYSKTKQEPNMMSVYWYRFVSYVSPSAWRNGHIREKTGAWQGNTTATMDVIVWKRLALKALDLLLLLYCVLWQTKTKTKSSLKCRRTEETSSFTFCNSAIKRKYCDNSVCCSLGICVRISCWFE